MLGIADSLKQTCFYQEAVAEGRAEGRAEVIEEFVLKLLNYRFGELSPVLKSQIEALSLEQLD